MRKNVLFLCSSPTPYRNPLFGEISRHRDIKLFVCFCVWRSGTRPWKLGGLDGVRHEVLRGWHIPTGKGNYVRINWSVLPCLIKEEPDVVVIAGYNHPTMLMALIYCVLTRTPFLVQGETWRARSGWKSVLKRRFLHPLLFRAQSFLVTGRLARDYWIREGYPAERIKVFANTPDIEYLQREVLKITSERKSALREDWGCAERRVLVFVGRLIRAKGLDLLLEALRALEDRKRPFLVIIGDGVERARLECAAEGLPVQFLGFLQKSSLPEIYAAADGFVLVSRREPWGVVVNEAMACGLPLVLSEQVGAHGDLLVEGDGGNGILVEGPEFKPLREALQQFGELSCEQLRRMGAESRRIIEGWKYGFSVENFVSACSHNDEH